MSSKFTSRHFANTNGTSLGRMMNLLGVSPDEPTATVWPFIEATAGNYPGTDIPRSFVIHTSNGSFWTHGNATEHMNEAVIALKKTPGLEQSNPSLFSQFILYDYRKSITKATKDGVKFDRLVESGHWVFKFSKRDSDEHTVVVHAMFTGLK